MSRATSSKRCRAFALGLAFTSSLIVGCDTPHPRGFIEYMEDAVAREATLARCNADRRGTVADPECANARRAAAAVAARADSARRAALERQSEERLAALRRALTAREEAERREALAAEAAAQAAYDASWVPLDPRSDTAPDAEIVTPTPPSLQGALPLTPSPVSPSAVQAALDSAASTAGLSY